MEPIVFRLKLSIDQRSRVSGAVKECFPPFPHRDHLAIRRATNAPIHLSSIPGAVAAAPSKRLKLRSSNKIDPVVHRKAPKRRAIDAEKDQMIGDRPKLHSWFAGGVIRSKAVYIVEIGHSVGQGPRHARHRRPHALIGPDGFALCGRQQYLGRVVAICNRSQKCGDDMASQSSIVGVTV